MNKKISIVIPVYNAEMYIRNCVNSVLTQTYDNLEIILVDDGSSDGTFDICSELSLIDDRIKVFHKSNGGVSAARNYGIDQATGYYICFIDSDDWIEERYLESFFKYGSDCNFVSQGILFDDNKKTWPFFIYDDRVIESNYDFYFSKNKIIENGCPVGKLFCLKIIRDKNIRFPEEISFHEDHVFVLRYLQHVHSIHLISESLYHYMKLGEVTLSSNRRFSINQLCTAAVLMISEIDVLTSIFNLVNISYLKSIYSDLGAYMLYQSLNGLEKDPTSLEKTQLISLAKQLLKYPLRCKYFLYLHLLILNLNFVVLLHRLKNK